MPACSVFGLQRSPRPRSLFDKMQPGTVHSLNHRKSNMRLYGTRSQILRALLHCPGATSSVERRSSGTRLSIPQRRHYFQSVHVDSGGNFRSMHLKGPAKARRAQFATHSRIWSTTVFFSDRAAESFDGSVNPTPL
jgi:hypothetical protein